MVALMFFQTQQLAAHGGVVSEEDLCIIEIGVFSAHFTVYQPETRASTEYCEDIPDVGEVEANGLVEGLFIASNPLFDSNHGLR